MSERGTKRQGFSLIELLVATVILIALVLITSMIYHQASLAWNGGLRKVEGNMTGRSILGIISKDLMNAVADPGATNLGGAVVHMIEGNIWCTTNGMTSIQIVTLTGNVTTNYRVAKKIYYTYNSLQQTILRGEYKMKRPAEGGHYGEWGPVREVALVSNVCDLKFTTPLRDGGVIEDYKSDLPAWVRVRLGLQRKSDVSGVSASSAGPDGVFGNSDDIINN